MAYPVISVEMTGARIHEILQDRGISVAAVSRFLGINRSSMYKVLRGESLMSLDNIYALSVYLGIGINDLIVAA